MKKNLTLLLIFTLVLTLFAGCGSPQAETAPSDPEEITSLKVILLVPGSLGDKSFFDSANAGMKLIESNYDCTTKVIEMGTDDTKFASTIEDVIDEGWDIIITGGINISQPLQMVAEKYPDQKFILYDEPVDYSDGKNSNIYSMTYKAYEGSFLAGALAAMVTTSEDMPNANPENIIGFAGGFDIPLINDFLMGYIQGAQYIDKDIKVGVGYMNSFTDAAKGKEVGVALYNAKADVIYQAAGGAGLGVLDAAKEQKSYAIGTDSDQSVLFAEDADKSNAILASMLKRVDLSIEKAIGAYIEGTLEFGTVESYGIAEGCIELTDNDYYQRNIPESIRTQMSDIMAKASSGEIEVRSAFDMTEDEIIAVKNSVKP